ncbi:unnamed protein product [Ectocarpus sp. 8 AP-2014]
MIAVVHGHSRVVTLLLDRGADVSRKGGTGITALHFSAASGNLAMTEMLMAAGANLEERYQSATPLQLAMGGGHLEVMRAMVKAGVNVDRRHHSGATALSAAASDGLLDVVELLLGANANPWLTMPNSLPGGPPLVALDAAARGGHAAVVRRMIELGIEGCGGATIGVSALYQAATNQRMDVMGILVDAGVVDNGYALVGAAACGAEASVKFLLQQHGKKNHTYFC